MGAGALAAYNQWNWITGSLGVESTQPQLALPEIDKTARKRVVCGRPSPASGPLAALVLAFVRC